MKTLTVSQADRRLGKLIEEVHAGEPVLLKHGRNIVKMSRYEPASLGSSSAKRAPIVNEHK